MKVKIFEINDSRKPRANTDNPFGLKRFFYCINITDKDLVETKLLITFYISLVQLKRT